MYLAIDTQLGRDVALSLLKADAGDRDSITRLRREAESMAKLGDHPNIVTIHDIGEDRGRVYIVTQYLEGGSLADQLRESPGQRLPVAQALQIALEICRALEHAHASGVVHRDLKPGNVWLTADGTAVLGDFGLAVSGEATRLTEAGKVVGTTRYLPPEQALGRPPEPRGDLYSFGVMLFEMVAGTVPFAGNDHVAVVSQHLNAKPVSPALHNPEVFPQLELLILELLAKDPHGRPDGARSLRERLEECLELAASATPLESTTEFAPFEHLAMSSFVGRRTEITALRATLDRALGGELRIAMVAGEPGIGKTRIATELVTYAQMRGAKPLWGRCFEGEGAPAYWPWVQILRTYVQDVDPNILRFEMGSGAMDLASVVSEVRERLPEIRETQPLPPEEARFRFFDSVVQLLRSAAERQPLLLVLDDLHQADAASLLLLQFLAGELGPSRLMLIGTYRDVGLSRQHPLSGTLAELARAQNHERITLRGLERDDVSRFLEQSTHHTPPDALVEAVFRETEGNPFFVHEVVRLLASDGRLDAPDEIGSWSVEIPQGVRDVIGRRLNQVSEGCNAALRSAAVLGRDFDLQTLRHVARIPDAELIDALDEAIAHSLLDEPSSGSMRYRFSHALLRETLYEELSAPRRAVLHQSAGEALQTLYEERPGEHLAEIAHHFFQASHAVGPSRASAASERAGAWAASQLAFEDAIVHYERAIEALEQEEPPEEERLCALLIELARLSISIGRRGAMERAGDRALELAERLADAELRARATIVLYAVGGPARPGSQPTALAVDRIEKVLEGPVDDASRVLLLLALALQLNYDTPQSERRRALREQAQQVAARLDDPGLRFASIMGAPAESINSSSLSTDGELEELVPHSERAAEAAAGLGRSAECFARGVLGTMRLVAGDIRAMRHDLAEVRRMAQEVRVARLRYVPGQVEITELLLHGELDEAARRLDEVELPEAERATFHYQLVRWRPPESVDRMRERIERTSRARFAVPVGLAIRGGIALDSRDVVAGAFERLSRDDFTLLPHGIARSNTLCHSADAAVYLGRLGEAAQLYELMSPYPSFHAAIGTPILNAYLGSFAHRLGTLSTLLGEYDRAQPHFDEACTWAEEAGARPWVAEAQLEQARSLRLRGGTGDAERAQELLASSRKIADEIGAPLLAARAQEVSLENGT